MFPFRAREALATLLEELLYGAVACAGVVAAAVALAMLITA
ncbi:MAG TPA: hypothetical protein VFZ14_06535 [Burkholderiales bacterium]|nr:hypothetical protein [Burkholderiales bacterium]